MAGGRNVPPGPGVDASGQSVIDPTKNVSTLVNAAVDRLDDLREQEAVHVREIMALRFEAAEKLALAETSRINAIRAVDVGASAILASQVAAAADALRQQVEATRQQTATGQVLALEPIQKDIQDLRRVQYEAVGGKANVVETRATLSNRGMWIGVAVAAAGVFSVFLIGVVAIVVTLIVHG